MRMCLIRQTKYFVFFRNQCPRRSTNSSSSSRVWMLTISISRIICVVKFCIVTDRRQKHIHIYVCVLCLKKAHWLDDDLHRREGRATHFSRLYVCIKYEHFESDCLCALMNCFHRELRYQRYVSKISTFDGYVYIQFQPLWYADVNI